MVVKKVVKPKKSVKSKKVVKVGVSKPKSKKVIKKIVKSKKGGALSDTHKALLGVGSLAALLGAGYLGKKYNDQRNLDKFYEKKVLERKQELNTLNSASDIKSAKLKNLFLRKDYLVTRLNNLDKSSSDYPVKSKELTNEINTLNELINGINKEISKKTNLENIFMTSEEKEKIRKEAISYLTTELAKYYSKYKLVNADCSSYEEYKHYLRERCKEFKTNPFSFNKCIFDYETKININKANIDKAIKILKC